MGRKVNIVLPSGKTVSVDESVANQAMGVSGPLSSRPEGTGEAVARERKAVNIEKFSGAVDKALTVGEGFLSTLTLGAIDPLINDEATRTRAEVNPGYRTAGEIGGIIAPALVGDEAGLLGSVIKNTPGGLASRGAAALAEKAGGSAVRRLAVAGAAEGAAQGIGGAVSHAELSDDPLTVEAVLHGAGRGGLLGFGLGAIAGTISRVGTRAAAAETKISAAGVRQSLDAEPELFANTINTIKGAKNNAKALIESNKPSENWSALNEQLDGIQDAIIAHPERAQGLGVNGLKESASLRKQFTTAMKSGDGYAAIETLGARRNALESSLKEAGINATLPEIPSYASLITPETKAAAELRVPSSLDDFASWTPKTVADWVNTAKTASPDALSAMDELARRVGVAGDDASVTVTGLHNALREMSGAASSTRPGILNRILKQTGREVGGRAGRALGAPEPIGSLLHQVGRYAGMGLAGGPMGLVAEVLGLRASLTSRVRTVIAKYGESGGTALGKLSPVLARLGVDMNGNKEEGDARDLAAKRADELYRFAPSAADAAYAVAAPMVPEAGANFAHALADNLTSGVQYLLGFAPKDPGTASVMGKSDWKPSYDQAEEFAARLEAANDPWAAIERQLSGEGDQAGAETLWQLYPGTMREVQLEVIANTPIMQTMSFEKVMALSMTLRTQLDGLLLPENITALQSHFIPGNVPPQKPGAGRGTGGAPGRPAASTPPTGGTQVQNLTR